MSELCDDENERHAKSMRPYRGFPGSRPLPEHQRHDHREFNGQDPELVADDLQYRGFTEVELPPNTHIVDMRLLGTGRLFVKFEEC